MSEDPRALMRALDRASSQADREVAARQELDALLTSLVDVLDSFDRLLGFGDGAGPGSGVGELRDGSGPSVAAIARQLTAVCRQAGIRPYGAVGDDPSATGYHVTGTRSGTPPGAVLEVQARGWIRDGRTFRSCRVIAADDSTEEETG